MTIAREAADVMTFVITDEDETVIEMKIRRIGNSLGVVIPREALERLGLKEGERAFLTEAPDGYRITPYDPEFERQMQLGEEGMAAYRNTLRALAK